MWQTKYAWMVPKNLGLGFDFWPCSKGNFLTGRPQSVALTKGDFFQEPFVNKKFPISLDFAGVSPSTNPIQRGFFHKALSLFRYGQYSRVVYHQKQVMMVQICYLKCKIPACTKFQKVSNTVFWKLEASQEPIDKLVHKATLLLHNVRNFHFLPQNLRFLSKYFDAF